MPPEDELPSLWLYGEMEPWRRGRIILVSIATFYALLQALVFFLFLFAGSLEIALVFAIGLVLWWLGFAFIWFGTHWVRWLLGASTLLSGFIYFIWGIRDQSALQWSVGVLDLFIGAFCFAPSVHFFARHQKEQIRWPEKLVVVAIFFLLAGSVLFALLGIGAFTASVREEAEDYGRKALRRVFAENDTVFLLDEANAAVMERYGRLGLSGIMAQKFMQLGTVEDVRLTNSETRSRYQFPWTVTYEGRVTGEGVAKCGRLFLLLELTRSSEGWQIAGVQWQCQPR